MKKKMRELTEAEIDYLASKYQRLMNKEMMRMMKR